MITATRCLLPVLLGMIVLAGCTQSKGRLLTTPLISRDVLFGNPDKASPRISPDGASLAYLAPVDGVLNIWVGPLNDPAAAQPITKDTHRGIRSFFWAYTNDHVIYTQDADGDENWRVYCVDLSNNEVKNLTPQEGVAARIQEVSPRFPDEILVAVNDRDPQLHDIHRVNIRTGESSLLLENEGYASFITDDDMRVRLATRTTPTGGSEYFRRTDDGWEPFATIDRDDQMTTGPAGFDKSGENLYMLDSRGRNTAALVKVNLATGQTETIAESERADINAVLRHPTEKTIQAVSSTYLRRQWQFMDLRVAGDFDVLRSMADGEVNVVSRSLDDQEWIVAITMDNGPVGYYHFDRTVRRPTLLFTSRPALEGLALADMHPVTIKSRDGLNLISYLTLPVGSNPQGKLQPSSPLPMVLLVHGGPWARNSWGYHPWHQWLANRGYAVLSVNFRASTGFGKNFINAGDHEFSAKMHDDLIDAVNWAIAEKIADPDRVAIMGGSYGGYATLVGLTFTPDVFSCGVDICGPSNMVTLLESIPPYWAPILDMLTSRIGDHRTAEGKAYLEKVSPLHKVDAIRKPLLIGQGANDPRVKQAESDQIVQAMQAKNIPVTYVLYADEGHGFRRPENNTSFNAVAEAFLAEHLGGRCEPVGDDFVGSSITVPTGADSIAGLTAALSSD